MPTRQEALKRVQDCSHIGTGPSIYVSRRKSRTYKGHGDDYAVVEKGLMARGVGSRVVMQQPVRARRRRTLVLHTPPSLPVPTFLPPAPATEGDASPGKCHLLRQPADDGVGCRVFRRLQPELALAPFSVPASGKPAARSCITCRVMEEGQEVHLRRDQSSIEPEPQKRNFLRSFTLQPYILPQM